MPHGDQHVLPSSRPFPIRVMRPLDPVYHPLPD